MQVIYVDTLFLINFIIDYLTLLLTAKICSVGMPRLRIALGALTGSAYSVLAIFEPFQFMVNPAVKIAAGILMALIVFGGQKKFFRVCLVFFAVSAAFGGAVLAVSLLGGTDILSSGLFVPVTFKILVFSFALSYAVFSLVFKRTARNTEGGGISDVCIERNGSKVRLRALRDTGNSLADPLTGRPVLITDVLSLSGLFDAEEKSVLTEENIRNPVRLLEQMAEKEMGFRLRLIPYKAIGVTNGMLAAFMPDKVTINGKVNKNMLVALSPDGVTDGGAYAALVSG